jgi:hypothetical protein
MVMNDVNSTLTQNLYTSDPIGLEVQRTIWAYNRPGALGNTIFISYKFINKSGVPLDSVYVSQWADPDLGYAGDDATGCDTTRSIGYVYNGAAIDANFANLGLPPPAVGFDFFQGPLVPGSSSDSAIFDLKYVNGKKNLPMTAFDFFINGNSTYSDPNLNSNGPDGTPQWYNLMRGLISTKGTPFSPSVTGGSIFCYPGDPVTGVGPTFIGPAAVAAPGDVRMCLNSGPFSMATGDTQQVVVAAVVGLGSDYLSSISVLRSYDDNAQDAYNQLFQLAVPPPQPYVSVVTLDKQIVLSWGNVNTAPPGRTPKEIEGSNSKGYQFEGYNVWQFPSNNSTGGKLLATYDLIDGIRTIQDTIFSPTLGSYTVVPTQFGQDKGLQHSLAITKDAFTGSALVNDRDYYFAVTAYSYNLTGGLVPHSLETSPSIMTIRPQTLPRGVTSTTTVGDFKDVTHNGSATASVDVNVVDPLQVTGHQYQVIFHDRKFSYGSDGEWTDITALTKKRLSKTDTLTGSSVTAMAASYSDKVKGAIDIHYMVDVQSVDYDWCDGVELKFPAGVTIDFISKPISGNDGSEISYTYNKTSNSIFFGDSSRSTGGLFAGGEEFVVRVHPATLPITIQYNMYDDNYGGGVVDVSGTDSFNGPIADIITTQNQWDVKDVTTGNIVVKDQTIVGGKDLYAPDVVYAANSFNGPGGSTGSAVANVGVGANVTFDGIQLAVNGSYDPPITFSGTTLTKAADSKTSLTHSGNTGTLDILNYTYFSGINTSKATEDFGVGTDNIDTLQKDYELRFTGVWDSTVINGQTVHYVKSGGQMATCFRMVSGAALANNPLNPSPGTAAPFLIRIPFEVWCLDDNQQVNLTYRDRLRNGTEDPFYSWNLTNRMYAIIVDSPYDPNQVIQVDDGPDAINAAATWTLVFYGLNYNMNFTGDNYDKVTITYPNPIQLGKDNFTLTVPEAVTSTTAANDISKINVFPNPYFGFNKLESDKYSRFVRFTHLPVKATIRIYNLAGILVRTLQKDNAAQYQEWDLLNDHSLPVAAGMYIAYIDMPDLGKTKTLKLAIIPEQQFLDHY